MSRRAGSFAPLAFTVLLLGCAGGGDGGGEEMSTGQPSQPPPLPPDVGNPTPHVVLETNKGTIVLELDREKAPLTVDNVVEHVAAGFYDSLTFHRVIPGFMIQGGGFTSDLRRVDSSRPPVRNEANNGLKNLRGTVAMARTNDPHSATTQFFINVVDNPRLDFQSETPTGWGYAVFGRVIEGMEVVDAIAAVTTSTQESMADVPVTPVVIEKAYVRNN